MNVDKFRLSLKKKWLTYYQENRDWLIRLGVWVTCQGQRRPSSSFILATLSILEPKLTQLLPLVVDLNSNPDRIVLSLGLNFNPDDELNRLASGQRRLLRQLPASNQSELSLAKRLAKSKATVGDPIDQQDEDCVGRQREQVLDR